MEPLPAHQANRLARDVEQASRDLSHTARLTSAPRQKNERPHSTSAVDGGRLNPWVQVGAPRGIWEEAGTAASSNAS
jgi:hypothetical protein